MLVPAQPAVFYGTDSQACHLPQASWPKRKCLVEGCRYRKAKGSSEPFLNPAGSTAEPLFRSGSILVVAGLFMLRQAILALFNFKVPTRINRIQIKL